jgi:CheY-like chemotaxis protein
MSTHGSSTAPILVVDDDVDFREAMRLVLEDKGYSVAEAATATEALMQLQAATRGHIVVLDWRLADRARSLLQALEQERADGPLRQHQVMLLTAMQPSRLSDEERRLIAATCLATLTKPFDLDALYDAVTRAATRLTAS